MFSDVPEVHQVDRSGPYMQCTQKHAWEIPIMLMRLSISVTRTHLSTSWNMLWRFQSWTSTAESISRIVIVKQALSISVVIIVCAKQPPSVFMPISVMISLTEIDIVECGHYIYTLQYFSHVWYCHNVQQFLCMLPWAAGPQTVRTRSSRWTIVVMWE